MNINNVIKKFPEINEKNSGYYLYIGLISGLPPKQLQLIITDNLEEEILKRKIILNNILFSAKKWTRNENNALFDQVFKLKDTLSTYYKKENASLVLMTLFPFVSKNRQISLINNFSQSNYRNNRKRIYSYFYHNWSPLCEKIVEMSWLKYQDPELVGLIIGKMPAEFLKSNFKNLRDYFDDESLEYDFFRKRIRNNLYIRAHDKASRIIEKLKDTDPISYIFIKKELKEKLDILWAIKIYKKFAYSRYLARWYSEMGLWDSIFKTEPTFISEIIATKPGNHY